MVTQADFIELPITDDIRSMSLWLAQRRIIYEYPGHDPNAFGEYDERHIPVIQKGIIGELAAFEHFHDILVAEYGHLPPMQRWEQVRDRLCLQNRVGRFDEGSDLMIVDNTLDVKVYADRELVKQQMLNYNLFVNVNEVQGKDPADFYIQAFLTPGQHTIVLAGYHAGLPGNVRVDIPSPAHACPVRDLSPIQDLADILLQ